VHPQIALSLQQHEHVCVETTGASDEILTGLLALAPAASVLKVRVAAPLDLCLQRVATRDSAGQIPMDSAGVRRVYQLSMQCTVEPDVALDNLALTDDQIVALFVPRLRSRIDHGVTIVKLRERPELIGFLAEAFEREWPAWYGPGGNDDAMSDLTEWANPADGLPLGIVALASDGSCIGAAALKQQWTTEYAHWRPWAAAGYVVPDLRRRGIGAALLSRLALEARGLGFDSLFCATATAGSLLRRLGWHLIESTEHDGLPIEIFATASPKPTAEQSSDASRTRHRYRRSN